jgi:catechol 2,3-dioxygenase
MTTLPPTLRLGPVHLVVSDLDRSVPFYREALGLALVRRDDEAAVLGAGDAELVHLTEHPGARRAGRHAGLFHVAILHPDRGALGHALRRLAATRTPLTGASDHGVSEAIYLDDPDGNGIELYADRPRAEWPAPSAPGERVGMYTIPLDIESVVEAAGHDATPPEVDPGTVVGHVHLHVGGIAQGIAFYDGVLGFDPMATIPSAAFLAAGGYHHHLGINVWRGEGVGPAPPGTVGLARWTVLLETAEEVDGVRVRVETAGYPVATVPGGFETRDPWDIVVRVAASP